MESKELRTFVLVKIADKQAQFNELVKSVENYCIGILIDCKVVIVELDSVKKIASLIVDEADDRIDSGIMEPIDAPLAKGLLDKILFNTPWGAKLEEWYKGIRNKALNIIGKETEMK